MFKFLILLLLPINSFALGLSDDLCLKDKCRVAVDAAQEATLHQIGFYKFYNQLKSYTINRATKESVAIIKQIGVEKEVATSLLLYKIYRTREITYRNYKIGLFYANVTFTLDFMNKL